MAWRYLGLLFALAQAQPSPDSDRRGGRGARRLRGTAAGGGLDESAFSPRRVAGAGAGGSEARKLSATAARPGADEWVAAVTLSEGFVDMFENWFYHFEKLNLNMTLVVVAEDRPTYELYKNRFGLVAWPTKHAPSDRPQSHEYQVQHSAGWYSLVSRRADHLLRLLRAYPNVIYSDVDTVWLGDPRPFLAGDRDFWAAQDTPPRVCTGFLAFRGLAANSKLLEAWDEVLKRTGGANQRVFNVLLSKQKPNVDRLPVDAFTNGQRYYSRRRNMRDKAVVVHNNYMHGKDSKIRHFKEAGLWHA